MVEKTAVRGVVVDTGMDFFREDTRTGDSKGVSDLDCGTLVFTTKRSPGIASSVHADKDVLDVGASNQGMLFGYARDETEDAIPLSHSIASLHVAGKVDDDTQR